MKLQFDVDELTIPWEYDLMFVGQRAGHNPYIYHVISEVLSEYKVESIIEVGTYQGALTMYLGLWGARLNVPVLSVDIEDNLYHPVYPVLERLGVTVFSGDVFENLDLLTEFIGGKPTYLVCDGGDKAREFDVIGKIVPVGSVISIHDWGTEVSKLDSGFPMYQIGMDQWRAHDVRFASVQKIGE